MKRSLHSYNTGYYFSTGIRVFGWIATGLSVMMILSGSIAAFAFLPAGIITQYTHYRTEFDLEQKTYREGVRFASITVGKMLPLAGLDFLYLKRNRYKQIAESRGSMSAFQFEKYDGYIRLLDDVKLHLLQRKSKEQALRDMQQIAQDLQIELRDLTEVKMY